MKNIRTNKKEKRRIGKKQYVKPQILNQVPIETRTGSNVPSPYTSS